MKEAVSLQLQSPKHFGVDFAAKKTKKKRVLVWMLEVD